MENMKQIFDQLGYNVTKVKFSMLSEEKQFYYIANNDGTIRCMWPVKAKHPLLLDFNNDAKILSDHYTFFIKLIFKLKLQSQVFGKTTLYVVKNENKKIDFDIDGNWTIFNELKEECNTVVFTQSGSKLNSIKLNLN